MTRKETDMQVNVFEAVRIATDPSGDNTAHHRPSAKEVLERLGRLGYVVVPREMTRPRLKLRRTNDDPLFVVEG